jgi:GNAT superfamily N-acetyltransferase
MALAMATAQGFHSLSLAADGGSADVAGAFCWHSKSHVPVFNAAGVFTRSHFNRGVLAAIDEYFAGRGRAHCLVTLDGLVSNTTERLRELGYYEFDNSPVMWLDGPCLRWQEHPPDLEISTVRNPNDLTAFRTILGRVFAIAPSEVNLVLSDRTLEVATVRHYIGRVGGLAVATTSMVLSGPVAGIWNVGILPEYRRRGIAAELMHNAVSEALTHGYSSTMLLASQDGLPLYERLGYNTLSTARMFAPARY